MVVRQWVARRAAQRLRDRRQGGRWTHRQASKVEGLVAGWRLRRLFRCEVIFRCRSTLGDVFRVVDDLEASASSVQGYSTPGQGEAVLLQNLRSQFASDKLAWRRLLLGKNRARLVVASDEQLRQWIADSLQVRLGCYAGSGCLPLGSMHLLPW